MTRFGVMKHLKVLEEAGLVVTKGEGGRTGRPGPGRWCTWTSRRREP